MAASTINSVVKSTVTLGKDGYHSRLDITATGAVLPTTYGADAIIDSATVHNGFITNHGTVAGA
jgi:hypothetical protein